MKLDDIRKRPSNTLCDFCSASLNGAYKLYLATNRYVIHLEDGIVKDDGEWLACIACASLKDANKWNELLERSVNNLMQANHIPENERASTVEYVRLIWQRTFLL